MVKRVRVEYTTRDGRFTSVLAAGISTPVGSRQPGDKDDSLDVQLVRLYMHLYPDRHGGALRKELTQSAEHLANGDNWALDLRLRILALQNHMVEQGWPIKPDVRVSVPRRDIYDEVGYGDARQRILKPWTIAYLAFAWASAFAKDNEPLSKCVDCPEALRKQLAPMGL